MSNCVNLLNRLCVVGYVKNIESRNFQSSKGENGISIKMTICSTKNEKKQEHVVEFMTMDSEKTKEIYQSYLTIVNTYKSIKTHGEEADRVCVVGSLETNEFFNTKKGELVFSNRLRGSFANRIGASDDRYVDGATADVEGFIVNCIDEIDKTGNITGRKKVRFVSVGYNEESIFDFNVIVPSELAEPFTKTYAIGTRTVLHFDIDNYILTSIKSNAEQLAFGKAPVNNIVTKYIREIIVASGEYPVAEKQIPKEQIGAIVSTLENNRKIKIKNGENAMTTPKANNIAQGNAFGNLAPQINNNVFDNIV